LRPQSNPESNLPNVPIKADKKPQPSKGFKLFWQALFLCLLLIIGILWGADSPVGHRLLLAYANTNLKETGLELSVAKMQGSIFGTLSAKGIEIKDKAGSFATLEQFDIVWSPRALVERGLHISKIKLDHLHLERIPNLKLNPPRASNEMFKQWYIALDEVSVTHISFGSSLIKSTPNRRPYAQFTGHAQIKRGKAEIMLNAYSTLKDKVSLRFSSEDKSRKLDLAAMITAPKGGLLSELSNQTLPFEARLTGSGSLDNWAGQMVADAGNQRAATLILALNSCHFTLKGPIDLTFLNLSSSSPWITSMLTLGQIDWQSQLNAETLNFKGQWINPSQKTEFTGRLDLDKRAFTPSLIRFTAFKAILIESDFGLEGLKADIAFEGPLQALEMDAKLRVQKGWRAAQSLGRLNLTLKGTIGTQKGQMNLEAKAYALNGLEAFLLASNDPLIMSGRVGYDRKAIILDKGIFDSPALSFGLDASYSLDNRQSNAKGNFALKDQYIKTLGRLKGRGAFALTGDDGNLKSLTGEFNLVGRQLDNTELKRQLGDHFSLKGAFETGFDRVIRLERTKLTAPKLNLLGQGRLSSSQQLSLGLSGHSKLYGAVQVAAKGPLTRLNIEAFLARADLGLAWHAIKLTAYPQKSGHGFLLTANSDRGPLKAEGRIDYLEGLLKLSLARLSFADLMAAGEIKLPSNGFMTGAFTASGEGLKATATLSTSKSAQQAPYMRADIVFSADKAKLKAFNNLHLRSGFGQGQITFKRHLEFKGDVQLADLSLEGLSITRTRLKMDYDGATSKSVLQGVTEGFSRNQDGINIPFDLSLNSQGIGTDLRLNAKGNWNAKAVELVSPAEISHQNAVWRLNPVTVRMGQGLIRIEGHYGATKAIVLVAQNFDLSPLSAALSSTLALDGQMTGKLTYDLDNNNTPDANLAIRIDNFTHSGLMTRTAPFDLLATAQLKGRNGEFKAIINQQGTSLGQAKLSLRLDKSLVGYLPDLSKAQIKGGIRYNGPASLWLNLLDMPDHHLSGLLILAADIEGPTASPRVTGRMRGKGLSYRYDPFETRINDIDLEIDLKGNRAELVKLTGRAGKGTLSLKGQITTDAMQNFPAVLTLDLDDAQLARSDNLSSSVSGQLIYRRTPSGPSLKGQLRLPETRYVIAVANSRNIEALEGVRRKKGTPFNASATKASRQGEAIDLLIDIAAPRKVLISGLGLESEWRTKLSVRGTSLNPIIDGQLQLIRGTYDFAGRRFVMDEGRVIFDPENLTNPQIELKAQTNQNNLATNLTISGRAQAPVIAFSSTPDLPQDEILSNLLFGQGLANLSVTQALQIANIVNSLSGGRNFDPLAPLRATSGLDSLQIIGEDAALNRSTALSVGKYISRDLYLEVVTDTKGFVTLQIELALSRSLSLLSQSQAPSGNSLKLKYNKDF
jgi:translocation and assembly module TamB